MESLWTRSFKRTLIASLAFWRFCEHPAWANPVGATVSQGPIPTFSTSGKVLTITTSGNTAINWQSFNIDADETTTFVEPSATSVVWNRINDSNPSQILGNLNANGYVVLQNSAGFYIGGSAVITAHGLVMTTSSSAIPNLTDGSAWSFDAPPPAVKIYNYGQINITGGGSAYLIADGIDNENTGTISAPGGRIGLYDGEQVLVSMAPDGRGLSAHVTLPQGSVDNEGNLKANAGDIALQAKTVNQNGLIQADSVQNVNGTIELVASDSLTLGANSTISAKGDATASSASPGGFVVLNAGVNTFADTTGSAISVAGTSGGQDGIIEVMGSGVTKGGLLSSLSTYYALLINPYDLTLSTGATTSSANPTLNLSALSSYAQIDLQALDNITLSSAWTLAGSTGAGISLTAGNDIKLNNSITAGNNWEINLTAGTGLTGSTVTANSDGIYLSGTSFLQTLNDDLNLWAANEIIVGGGAIRTIGGGSINATTEYGNINSGSNVNGYNYYALGTGTLTLPYYTPFQITGTGGSAKINFNQSNLGGIATAAGGNVTINAGGDVVGFPTDPAAGVALHYGDPGIGAFGPELGNVTINAGGSVYGNFILANGTGSIMAGQDIGNSSLNTALSLASGSWNLNAMGDIYLQEVRNPNGVFNNTTSALNTSIPSAGYHLFDYSATASVTLDAGNGVYLTGVNIPRPDDPVPEILPPTLIINAGAGGVTLDMPSPSGGVTLADFDITLFPSAYGNLEITTTGSGSLMSGNGGPATTLLMSDSAQTHWFSPDTAAAFNADPSLLPFGETDHNSNPTELNNNTLATLDISGNMDNVILRTDKPTYIHVDGDMIDCSFYGENLNSGETTTICVDGQIKNDDAINSIVLTDPLPAIPPQDIPSGYVVTWSSILALAVDPSKINQPGTTYSNGDANGNGNTASQAIANAAMFAGLNLANVIYDSANKTLFATASLETLINPNSTLTIADVLATTSVTLVRYGADHKPVISNGQIVTDTVTWVPASSPNVALIAPLGSTSATAPSIDNVGGAYVVGGPGNFDVIADSIDLGNAAGILTVGNGNILGTDYSFLTPYMTSGANLNVTVKNDVTMVDGVPTFIPSLYMPDSTIASLAGGNLTVTSENGSMNLGDELLVNFEPKIMAVSGIGLGIYTSAGGTVTVKAKGDIDIDSSRIASLDGGDVTVISSTGNVDAGSGGVIPIPINSFSTTITFPYQPAESVYVNGIVADTLNVVQADGSPIPGTATAPGNILVQTPEGSISADVGGILQERLNGTLEPGPSITLEAGTPAGGDWSSTAPPIYVGNVALGSSGAIGGTVNVLATGKVSGLLISSQDANVKSQNLGDLTVLAIGGTANVSSQGANGSITIIGAQGINASGVGNNATLLGQNVSVNGAAAQSTLATSAATTATSQNAAGQANDQAQKQVGVNGNSDEGDDQKKKKPGATLHTKRVTVLLSAAVPPH